MPQMSLIGWLNVLIFFVNISYNKYYKLLPNYL